MSTYNLTHLQQLEAESIHVMREVAAWRSQIGAARFDVMTATLWPNPQLNLGTGIVVAGRADPSYDWSPSLNIPLPIFGQLDAREREAKAALQVAEVSVAATVWERASEIRQALVERAFVAAEITELERNLEELARIDEIVRAREAAGANPRYDVLRLSTAEATFRAGLAAAKLKRDQVDTQLAALITAPDYKPAPITRAGLESYHGPDNEAALEALTLQRRPDLLLAQRGVVAALASADRYRKEVRPIPSVQLGAYVTHESFSASFQGGVSLTLPLFDRNQGLIGRAEATAEGQRALAAAVETRILAEVRGAWRARADARQALEEFEASGVGATDELLERAEVSYKAGGSFSILDLLDAYRTIWDARAQKLALERTLADADTELARAAGLIVPAPPDAAR